MAIKIIMTRGYNHEKSTIMSVAIAQHILGLATESRDSCVTMTSKTIESLAIDLKVY
jgi:hypothetical protein